MAIFLKGTQNGQFWPKCKGGTLCKNLEIGHFFGQSFSLYNLKKLSLKWLPSSVAFGGARVIASGSLTKVTWECSLYRPRMTRDQKMGQSEVRDFDSFFCQTVMRKTIGANWTRVIKHLQLLCNWQYFLLQSNACGPVIVSNKDFAWV